MSHSSSQTFLHELDKKIWTAADKLRSNLDAAVYKHAVLDLIFMNFNFAWVQRMLHHLAPNGSMALLLANRSMSPDEPTGPSRKSYSRAVKQKSKLDASELFN